MILFVPPYLSSGISQEENQYLVRTIDGHRFQETQIRHIRWGSISGQTSPGISCSLYPAAKAAPSNTEIKGLKAHLQKLNKNFGLSFYMNTEGENLPTRVGPAPLGGYLS